jgi:hypothetical protein
MHRLIMGFPQARVDHINGDGLDNRLVNLRLATKSQNRANCPVRRDNTSGYTGVTWHPVSGKWRSRIVCRGADRSLGLFESVEDAANARRAAEIALFGEFAPTRRS